MISSLNESFQNKYLQLLNILLQQYYQLKFFNTYCKNSYNFMIRDYNKINNHEISNKIRTFFQKIFTPYYSYNIGLCLDKIQNSNNLEYKKNDIEGIKKIKNILWKERTSDNENNIVIFLDDNNLINYIVKYINDKIYLFDLNIETYTNNDNDNIPRKFIKSQKELVEYCKKYNFIILYINNDYSNKEIRSKRSDQKNNYLSRSPRYNDNYKDPYNYISDINIERYKRIIANNRSVLFINDTIADDITNILKEDYMHNYDLIIRVSNILQAFAEYIKYKEYSGVGKKEISRYTYESLNEKRNYLLKEIKKYNDLKDKLKNN